MMDNSRKPKAIIFDINETLLDMSSVEKKVNKYLDSKDAFYVWFNILLQYSLVETVTDHYNNFSAIANATLDIAAKMLQTKVSESDKKKILEAMKELLPHKEVEEGLKMLKHGGFQLVTLTNSPYSTLEYQLSQTGLDKYFDKTLSVDQFQRYKPQLQVYFMAVETLGITTADALMVAAHGWDITGALRAGMKAAFIERKGQSLYALAPPPTFTGNTLVEVAEKILEAYPS